MRRIFFIIFLFLCVTGLSAQAELQRLLTTYTESVQLPLYKECKQYGNGIPKSIESVTLDGVALTFVYVAQNSDGENLEGGKCNTYTVKIDLQKSTIAKINNAIEFSCSEGIEIFEENGVTGKKYPFLVEKFSIQCNDSPLCNRLFGSMKDFETLEVNEKDNDSALVNASGNGKGIWSLSGRMLKGNMVLPSYSGSEHGVVVINIRVDASGKVIDAIIGSGTTVSSPSAREAAIEAAKKNSFTEGNSIVVGSITYRF